MAGLVLTHRDQVNHLVVAVYNEDTGWLDSIEGWEPLVVTKNVDLPNEGRECSSFFFGIQKLYRSLRPDDRVACVQGNPFEHCGDLAVGLEQTGPFVPLGHWHTTCDIDGKPHHPGLPLAEYWRDWIGTEPPAELSFTPGGQFSVSADVLHARPLEDYQRMVGEMSRPDAPWVMERLWPYYLYPKERL